MKKILIGTILLFSLASCGTTRRLSEEQYQDLQKDIYNSEFKIDVNRAFPVGARSVELTGLYSLEVKGDSVISYLPYFGRAYNVPYGGGAGLNFEGIVKNYHVQQSKKSTNITFNVKSPEDYLTYYVEIWPTGKSSITVSPQNRQQISYDGVVVTPKE